LGINKKPIFLKMQHFAPLIAFFLKKISNPVVDRASGIFSSKATPIKKIPYFCLRQKILVTSQVD
jgi:hypothetical protein